tara:strand:- start:1197 stop:1676 length:480 start_codon:yes stop_codon:yes gene_type:complete
MTEFNVNNVERPNPEEDGVTHIRLAPGAKTELGRLLHMGAHRPFTDPEYGQFASITAFWCWYTCNRSDALREIHHSNMIRASTYSNNYVQGAEEKTREVLRRSIENDPKLKAALENNTLPFISYDVVNFPKRGQDSNIVYVSTNIAWYDTTLNELSNID